MLKYRAISFPLLMGLLAVIFFTSVGNWLFAFCAILTVGLAAYECARMVDSGLAPCFPKTAGLISAGFIGVTLLPILGGSRIGRLGWLLWMGLVIFGALLPWVVTVLGDAATVKKGFATMGIVWAVIVPFGMVAVLYVPEPKYLLFVMLVTKAMDTGGYVFGMLSNELMPNGNHKLCPSISPKKSWEGFAGGVFLALLTAWALRAIFPGWDFSRALGAYARWKELVLAVLLALASIAGDLTESALKRKCGVKDSGNLIPGMGGPLDVLDSFIYVGPVCLLYTMILRAFNL